MVAIVAMSANSEIWALSGTVLEWELHLFSLSGALECKFRIRT